MSSDNRPLFERFPDVMCDTESTGLNFDRNAIIQISAVRFNLKEKTISHDFFDQCLMIPDNRFWDEGTRDWWLKKRDVLMGILSRGRPVKEVLLEFAAWAGTQSVMWAKPTHFDHVFLGSYFKEHGMSHPFFYRSANDMNSFIRSRYYPETPPEWEYQIPFEGPKHNAIFDCLHQIKVLFKVMEDTKCDSIHLLLTAEEKERAFDAEFAATGVIETTAKLIETTVDRVLDTPAAQVLKA